MKFKKCNISSVYKSADFELLPNDHVKLDIKDEDDSILATVIVECKSFLVFSFECIFKNL